MTYTLSITEIVQRAEARTRKAKELFAPLDSKQINWKSAPEKWSIAQCLDHLIVSNSTYIALFETLAAGKYKANFWEKYSPFTKYLGRKLYESMLPTSKLKMKAPKVFAPTQSELPADIVAKFVQHHAAFFGLIAQLPTQELQQTIVTSPAAKSITYSLADLLNILDAHEERHLLQAQNILKSWS